MTNRQPRHGPNDFYGSSGPPTPSGGAWPPPPLWRPAVSPTPARQDPSGPSQGPGDGSWPEPQGHAPKPRRSVRHLVGYPATALLALAVGAAPSGGATTAAAPAAPPAPGPTVTVTAPARTVTAPARTVTVTVAAAGASPARSSSGTSGSSAGVSPGGGSVYYADCSAARAAGDAPLSVGSPGYRAALDRDKDGVACE
jgi:hypothetical protein